MVIAVSAMTPVVPRSGSSATSTMTGAGDEQERTMPWKRLPTLTAARRQPVGEVDDERQLGELRGVHGRQRSELEPARRATPTSIGADRPDRQEAAATSRSEASERDVRRQRDQAQVAVVESRIMTSITTTPSTVQNDLRRDRAEEVALGSSATRTPELE